MPIRTTRRCLLVASLVSPFCLRADSQDSVAWLKTPGGGLQPQAVTDSRGVIHAVYLYGDPAAADIGYVRGRPGEEAFSAPIRVNDQPGSAIALGTVRGAHLAIGKSGRVHVAWNGSSKAEPKTLNNSSPMLYTRMNDRGDAFEPQRNLMTTSSGLDGGGTVAADGFGNVYVTWHGQGQKEGEALKGEEHRRVWLARSDDEGRTFGRESAVSPPDLGACGCCGMGAIADGEGNLYLLFRSARKIVHRDMYLLISRDRGKTFQSADLSPWEIGACPMSTASLCTNKRSVLLCWEKEKQVYFARLDARTGSVGRIIAASGEGNNRKHPSIAVNPLGHVLLAWTEGTGWKKGGSLAWQIFDEGGEPLSARSPSPGVAAWGFAAAVSHGDNFVVLC